MEQERLNGLAILSIEKANHASPLLCLKSIIRLAGVLCLWLCMYAFMAAMYTYLMIASLRLKILIYPTLPVL